MILTKECDYALRIIRQLSDYKIQTVTRICENESIPKKFAYKILKRLENVSILKSYRGQSGGYKLVAELENVTLYDIIQSVNNDIYLNRCVGENFDCPNNTSEKVCMVHTEFCRIQELLEQTLKEKSIKEILQK